MTVIYVSAYHLAKQRRDIPMNYLFPMLAAIIWGGNTVVSKFSASILSPIEISFYRWLLAVVVLTPWALPRVIKNADITPVVLVRLAVLGLLGCVIYQTLAYYAAHYTTATNMGIIQALVPMISLILSMLFLKHRTNLASIFGLIVSFVGVLLVVSNGRLSSLSGRGLNIGDGMILAGVVAFACYGLLLSKWKSNIPLLQSVYVQGWFAALTFLPLFLTTLKHGLSLSALFCITVAGIGASILAPLLWMIGINRLGPARGPLFFNLVPVVTTLLAVAFLGERLTIWTVMGGLLAITGVLIAETLKAPALPPESQ
jgi:drug/metabolite transporter (DMT)-like permease